MIACDPVALSRNLDAQFNLGFVNSAPIFPDAGMPELREGVPPIILYIKEYLESTYASADEHRTKQNDDEVEKSISPRESMIMNVWDAKAARRSQLIDQKYERGLSKLEAAELRDLTREITNHVDQIAPRSTEKLDRLEAYVRGLEARVVARRGKKR
jgi:hypothetical protein